MNKTKIAPDLKPFITIANGIASTFGKNCEVVLHDLRDPSKSVVYVKNAHVTDRKVGEGIRDLILDVLRSSEFKEDSLINYESTAVKGKIIKSSTMVIRNEANKIIGALCINFDITNMTQSISNINDLIRTKKTKKSQDEIEISDKDVLNILDEILTNTIQSTGKIPANMRKQDYLHIINFLDEKGVFLIKNSVEWIGLKLNLSKFTIYNYLKEVRTNKQMDRS